MSSGELHLPYIDVPKPLSITSVALKKDKVKQDSRRLIELSMGKNTELLDRNVKAWLRNYQTISLPQIDRVYPYHHTTVNHPLDKPAKRAKLTVMMDSESKG